MQWIESGDEKMKSFGLVRVEVTKNISSKKTKTKILIYDLIGQNTEFYSQKAAILTFIDQKTVRKID